MQHHVVPDDDVATNSGPEFCTPKDLSEQWRVKDETVYHLINRGELDAIDVSKTPGVGKPRWRIHRDAVHAYEHRHSASSQRERVSQLRAERKQRRRDRAARKAARKAEPVGDFEGQPS